MEEHGGDGAGLSLDELKSNLFSTLQKEGAIDQIRVHLRTTFVQKLQKRAATMNASTHECTLLEKVANTLLCEYLRTKQLKHTLSVFLPEVGPRNCELEPAMVAKMLRLPTTPASPAGLLEMLSQVERSASTSTHEMQTQTHDEDRRYILESELQRIDAIYVAQSHAQREQPAKSFEDRILQYQQEYDRMTQAHVAQEITRIRDTEIAVMRVDERKAYLHEIESVRSTLQTEFTAKQAALDEAERSLHLAYLEKQRQAELDLFELRQTLLKEMDAVQTKDRQLSSLIDDESRKWQTENRRLTVLQDNVAAREAHMVATMTRLEEDKATYTAHCEREAAARVARQQADLDALSARLANETESLRRAQSELTAFHSKMASLEVDVLTLRGAEADLKLQLEHATLELTHQKRHAASLQSQLQQTAAECDSVRAQCSCHLETIARLEREAKAVTSVADMHRKELDDRVHALQTELHTARASHVALRMESAEALIAAKEQLLAAHHADQESWLVREQRLRSQLHELGAKCAESDAAVGRYRTQLEDEQVHVASLRHEVESLSALVTSLKCAVPAREYAPRSYYEPRGTQWTHPPWQEARAPASAPPPQPVRVPVETRYIEREHEKSEAPPTLHRADDDAWRKHQEDLAREAERDLQVRELEARLEAAARDAEVARLEAQRQRDEERAADARKVLEDQRAREDALATQQKATEAALAALQRQEADREREAREAEAQRDRERAREAEAQRDRERAAQDALREQLAAEKDRVLAAKRELEAAREAQVREAEQLAATRQEQDAADRAAKDAREHEGQLAAARAAKEALEQQAAREASEAHARELRQAQDTQDALERQAHEAEVRQAEEAKKAFEREAQEATERQAREAQATSERLAREEQEAAERQAREDEEARVASEHQAREAQDAADLAATEARQAAEDDARRAEADRQAAAEEEERARLVHEAQIERARQAQEEEELDALSTQHTLDEDAVREAEARDTAAREAQAQADEAARLAQAAQQQDTSIIDEYRMRALARRAERQRQEEEAKLQAEREARVAAAAAEEEEAGFESDDALSVGGGDDDAAASDESF
ncbi:hypothetical protein SDRG_11529 [Saprolegnia diclina VS20]|uniref:Uncharacterized protein n=1 Tax=Saprolegnia diclina (strain VS20) TaxID=1156394 RepID=T0REQ3_SAPDV|nr:hypothetical protein SDRG_11529 [Saprolegnia diclina VS20]EQC30768.1 hypothetical protein SDRG_11529 [Saprolegnia diclina VS20]|eukprot:XP_008615792.1 hypothetical protein SDRG_11529 [Saprolegnia diclina VS20]